MSHEHLSALLDGECSAEELDRLLDEMERNPALKADWSRMCRSREMSAGTRIRPEQACICTGVMSRLDAQPEEFANPKIVELASRRKIFAWKPIAGLAAAASVAAVALLAGVSFTTQTPTELDSSAQATPVTQPVSYPVLRGSPRAQAVALRNQGATQVADEDLDNYLIEHNNSMAEQGMGGTLRYARFAAHTAAYRTDGQP